jgi:hypothetical protein
MIIHGRAGIVGTVGRYVLEEFTEQRRERCKPILKPFMNGLRKNKDWTENSKIGDAIQYALKE